MRVPLALSLLTVATVIANGHAQDRTSEAIVTIASGTLEGLIEPSGVRSFKGVPFAAAPVGILRWKAPQAQKKWNGTRKAVEFGARCMQGPGLGLVFRSGGASEDCLYLNIWAPGKSTEERSPVLVYFHGGGFGLGDGSEPRHDGERLARRGIVVITANYRLNIFGFFAHPQLTAESPSRTSGNYGLLDQTAVLRWTKENVAAFGGDPERVTVAGHSSGATAVSAHMTSPLSKGLIAGAIGSSGAMIHPTPPPLVSLEEAEQRGLKLARAAGAASVATLRTLSATELWERRKSAGMLAFPMVLDGHFLTNPPVATFAAGDQAAVPLMVGWALHEQGPTAVLGNNPPTIENFAAALKQLFGDRADEALKLYSASVPEEITRAAGDLGSDRFLAYAMWKWAELHGATSRKPVFRYINIHPAPTKRGADPAQARVARHGDDIDYVFGNLITDPDYTWAPEDEKVSRLLQEVYVNFVKRGDPNGPGVPRWPPANTSTGAQLLYVEPNSRVAPEQHRDRYLFLDSVYSKQ